MGLIKAENEGKAFEILNQLSGMSIAEAQELLGWCSRYLLNQPYCTWSKKTKAREEEMDNLGTIYRILRYLEKAMDYDEPDMDRISAERLKLTEHRWLSIMEMLAREGYITGIEITRSADGEVSVSDHGVRITLKGLEYLQENSLMRKAADLAKGIADVIK